MPILVSALVLPAYAARAPTNHQTRRWSVLVRCRIVPWRGTRRTSPICRTPRHSVTYRHVPVKSSSSSC